MCLEDPRLERWAQRGVDLTDLRQDSRDFLRTPLAIDRRPQTARLGPVLGWEHRTVGRRKHTARTAAAKEPTGKQVALPRMVAKEADRDVHHDQVQLGPVDKCVEGRHEIEPSPALPVFDCYDPPPPVAVNSGNHERATLLLQRPGSLPEDTLLAPGLRKEAC